MLWYMRAYIYAVGDRSSQNHMTYVEFAALLTLVAMCHSWYLYAVRLYTLMAAVDIYGPMFTLVKTDD